MRVVIDQKLTSTFYCTSVVLDYVQERGTRKVPRVGAIFPFVGLVAGCFLRTGR